MFKIMSFAANGVPFQMVTKLFDTKEKALERMKELKQTHEDVVMYVVEIK